MKTLMKIAFAAVLIRAVMYVVRKERSLKAREDEPTDAEPLVGEPIRPENLNVAQNAPF